MLFQDSESMESQVALPKEVMDNSSTISHVELNKVTTVESIHQMNQAFIFKIDKF